MNHNKSPQNTVLPAFIPLPHTDKLTTSIAGLTLNTPQTHTHTTPYNTPNTTLSTLAWSTLNYDAGSIALSDTYTKAMGLPLGQRFPWDETKGLYFVGAYHSIHCLVSFDERGEGGKELMSIDRKFSNLPFRNSSTQLL